VGKLLEAYYGTSDRPRFLGIKAILVKDEVLRDLVSTWTGQANSLPIRFQAKFDPVEPRIASVLSLLDALVEEIDRPGGVLESPAALASVEQTLLTFMLFGLEHNLSDALRAPAPQANEAPVKTVEAYIEAHAHEPIDMGTLVRVTGYSANSIYRAFRHHRQYSPMAYLREVRIRRTRSRPFQARPEDSVSKVALARGFTHLGRFSAFYKSRFGEKPSETLDRVLRHG
jgi:AraC-like DNA-binding protein